MNATVDLTDCDREPIHIPGAIQPFGAMLVLGHDWMVRRASVNASGWLDRTSQEILGATITELFQPEAVHAIRGRLQLAFGAGIVERLFGVQLTAAATPYDVAVHVSDDEIVIEFEPTEVADQMNAASMIRAMIGRVEAAADFDAMVREAARQVRALTGFDRVMIYRFDEAGAGEVIGESSRSGMAPFLGLRYPASDIPKQARALYERNLLRLIADVGAEPVPVLPALNGEGKPLDMSMSVLRAVSPIHIEYLKNMGVGASMSISLLHQGRLWGLIACHHPQPLRPSFDKRSAAELFGQMFSFLLESRLRAQEARFEVRVQEMQSQITASLAQDPAGWAEAPPFLSGVRELLECDGVGVLLGDKLVLDGAAPTHEEFLGLARSIARSAPGQVVATDCIAEIHPPAEDFVVRAAGMIAIPISRRPRDYLIAFRREMVQTVTWAGDPNKPASPGPNGLRLTPRKSFEAWREVMEGRSAPWTPGQQRAANSLRFMLMEVVLQLTDLADAQKAAAEKRQELLIGELNHRVRNILGLVRGVITQSSSSASSIADLTDVLEGRVQSMARAHDQLTARRWEPTPLRGLIEAEIEAYLGPASDRLDIVGPEVSLAPQACTPITLVIHELTTNAVKYGSLSSPHGRVEIELQIDEASDLHILWREVNGPPVKLPTRQGFGTTIIQQVIPFELMGESRIDHHPTGLVAELRIPAALAQRAEGSRRAAHKAAPALGKGAGPILSSDVLLLEDNLFIAIDAEEMLAKLGAASVTVSRSVKEALAAIDDRPFEFALLDVNLGDETSLVVAQRLNERGVPFAFGTGYGDNLALPPDLDDAAVMSKPYSLRGLRAGVAGLLQRAQSDQTRH